MLPRILIFTIPISFFVALAMSLFRLSKENETIVLFTLGYSSEKIARFFLFLAFIVSVSMLLISLFMMPLAENLKDNFVSYKKISANLNIKSSEFGQKFSDWLVFIDDQKDRNADVFQFFQDEEVARAFLFIAGNEEQDGIDVAQGLVSRFIHKFP